MIIWIASYPKSGNTWVRAFLSSYYYTEDGVYNPKQLFQIYDFPNPRLMQKEFIEKDIHLYWNDAQKKFAGKDVIFLKTHNALLTVDNHSFTTSKTTVGIIYVIRDPRNLITSLKNHMDFKNYEETFKFMTNEYAMTYGDNKNLAKSSYLSTWRTHYTSWIKLNNFNKFIIRYEDMVENPSVTFRKLILYTNKLSGHETKIDEDKFNNAIQTTNFENMKKSEKAGEFKEYVFSRGKEKKKLEFFYLGPKNDWRKLLDNNFADKLNKYFNDDLKVFGYKK